MSIIRANAVVSIAIQCERYAEDWALDYGLLLGDDGAQTTAMQHMLSGLELLAVGLTTESAVRQWVDRIRQRHKL